MIPLESLWEPGGILYKTSRPAKNRWDKEGTATEKPRIIAKEVVDAAKNFHAAEDFTPDVEPPEDSALADCLDPFRTPVPESSPNVAGKHVNTPAFGLEVEEDGPQDNYSETFHTDYGLEDEADEFAGISYPLDDSDTLEIPDQSILNSVPVTMGSKPEVALILSKASTSTNTDLPDTAQATATARNELGDPDMRLTGDALVALIEALTKVHVGISIGRRLVIDLLKIRITETGECNSNLPKLDGLQRAGLTGHSLRWMSRRSLMVQFGYCITIPCQNPLAVSM
ncbi:hypothetical protein Ct61P_15113 [Colletotrichum tofieldiae]|nr:hypothetical protein Ct61P_15113 [Colletotrichum tofieldiae]